MHTITKRLGTFGLALLLSLCVNTVVNAQSPADDPGIGGPGFQAMVQVAMVPQLFHLMGA